MSDVSLDMEFEMSGSEAENDTVLDINFKFTKQGAWVAVAYDEAFFIGQVIEVRWR
jgi:hypothetical protein